MEVRKFKSPDLAACGVKVESRERACSEKILRSKLVKIASGILIFDPSQSRPTAVPVVPKDAKGAR